MADVFISYCNRGERRALVRRIATILRAYDLTVWWDHGLEAGESFRERIEVELEKAGVVLPLWCGESVKSAWVLKEVQFGAQKQTLCPALIQNIAFPLEFSEFQTFDLIGWNGALDDRIKSFAVQICRRLGRQAQPPADLLEDLATLAPLHALDTVREVLGGSSFEVYSNYDLFGHDAHAEIVGAAKDSIKLMGLSVTVFHSPVAKRLGFFLREKASEGVPVQVLMADFDNQAALRHVLRDHDGTVTPRVANEIKKSYENWRELASLHSNISVRKVGKATIRYLTTLTPQRAVISPYWFATPSASERPTFVCKPNSIFHKLITAEFDGLWEFGSE